MKNKDKEKLKSCFWGHKWGKWKLTEVTTISIFHKTPITGIQQMRECARCNKIQITYL